MTHWASNQTGAVRVVLISSDKDFTNTLGRLQNHGVNIVVVGGSSSGPVNQSIGWSQLLVRSRLGNNSASVVNVQTSQDTDQSAGKNNFKVCLIGLD